MPNQLLTSGSIHYNIPILEEETKRLPAYVLGIGHWVSQEHCLRQGGAHAYQLSLCLGGKGRFIVDDSSTVVEPGDLFFFAPAVGHEYYAIEVPWQVIWLTFDGALMAQLFESFALPQHGVATCNTDVERDTLVSMLSGMFDALSRSQGRNQFKFSLALQSILHRLSLCRPKVAVARGNGDVFFDKLSPAMELIKNQYMQPITLQDLADAAHVSKCHFCNLFKEAYQMTPFQYLLDYRIASAKHLLENTELAVKQLARDVGFNDVSYFCQVFKAREQLSPQKYRAHHKQMINL